MRLPRGPAVVPAQRGPRGAPKGHRAASIERGGKLCGWPNSYIAPSTKLRTSLGAQALAGAMIGCCTVGNDEHAPRASARAQIGNRIMSCLRSAFQAVMPGAGNALGERARGPISLSGLVFAAPPARTMAGRCERRTYDAQMILGVKCLTNE